MDRELVQKSKRGLVLAKIVESGEPSLEIRFFDGRTQTRHLDCCHYHVGAKLERNRIVAVELGGLPTPEAISGLMVGSQVVVENLQGQVVARSELRINSSLVSLAPDGLRFAFIGSPGSPYSGDNGLYVASLQGLAARKIMGLQLTREAQGVLSEATSLDWSPDNAHVLFSESKRISVCDVRTGLVQQIAEGTSAQWAPTGDRVAYVTPKGQTYLLNVTTRDSRVILPGREILGQPLWSPDGDYLLILEHHVALLPKPTYARYAVYRVSDGTFLPISGYGVAGPRANWLQLRE